MSAQNEDVDSSPPSVRSMENAQRAFELRKVFAPELLQDPAMERQFNDELNADGALDAYAETIVWRLQAAHVMISLVDRGEQYFIAGAHRGHRKSTDSEDDSDIVLGNKWFGCASVSTSGGLCEHTLELDTASEEYPVFEILDLSIDERFKNLPVVNGDAAAYRYYAGTPITTNHKTNIGSLFIFDDKVRRSMSQRQKAFLGSQSEKIMRHLATKREAAERRRAALMSRGIAKFLDMTAEYRDFDDSDISSECRPEPASPLPEHSGEQEPNLTESPAIKDLPAQSSVLEKIRKTLDHAAEILRESLEITSGGVVFLDTTLANTEVKKNPSKRSKFPGSVPSYHQKSMSCEDSIDSSTLSPSTGSHQSRVLIRSSEDEFSTPKILAASVPKASYWEATAPSLNPQTLAELITQHTTGNVWSIDEVGTFSSFRQIDGWEKQGLNTPKERRDALTKASLERSRYEAKVLSEIFPKARQIVFLPLWDAGSNRWYSGVFIWSQSSLPVFTVDAELTYLSSFTNSMMVEISRLDAITANKLKSDFLGSISHEFRSPLHGILASAEFLRDTKLDSTQSELVGSIQNCSGTLLDTINHVLDYSKINSFEIAGNKEDEPTSQLYQVTNLALLCETAIEGLIAANPFRATSLDNATLSNFSEASPVERRDRERFGRRPEIILDLEDRDWNYKVESGALQRIVMNLVGNAQKFTSNGHVLIRMSIIEPQEVGEAANPVLLLSVKDTGKGISPEFMERKLYSPFAQEDSFVPGVGLGLSIVWSIVDQLGGKIDMKSELGKGTDVTVSMDVIPVDQPLNTDRKSNDVVLPDAEILLSKLRSRAKGKAVCIVERNMPNAAQHTELAWKLTKRYLTKWFGFEIKPDDADIVVTNDYTYYDQHPEQRILVVEEELVHPLRMETSRLIIMSNPLGPFKLARGLLALLDQDDAGYSPHATLTHDNSVESTTSDNPYSTSATSTSAGESSFSSQTHDTFEENQDTKPATCPTTDTLLNLPDRTGKHPRRPSVSYSRRGSVRPGLEILPPPVVPQSIPLPTSPPGSPHGRPANITRTSKLGSDKPNTQTSSESDIQKRSLRVLAVDDNDLNLQLLHRYLRKRKQDVVETAMDGVQAVEQVKNNTAFDVIFMDISMPNMDGFEATRQIRSYERSQLGSHNKDLSAMSEAEALSPANEDNANATKSAAGMDGIVKMPIGNVRHVGEKAFVVALTGLASRRDRDEAQQSGFDDFLTKPISFKRIGELLDRLSWEK